MIQTQLKFFLTLVIAVLGAASAFAHDLGAVLKVQRDKGTAEVEAFFDDGTTARGAVVRVVNAAKTSVAEGKTDARGKWSFPLPKAPGKYEVIVDGGGGHLAFVKFTVQEGTASPPVIVPEPHPAEKATSPKSASTIPASHTDVTIESDNPSREEFTRFPWLKASIGIGAIALLGLALFVSTRRNRKSS